MLPETFLGIKITHIAGGIAGGTVTGLMGGGGWRSTLTSVVVGGLTAAYATSPVYFGIIRYFPTWNDPTLEHLSSFIVGLSGLILCGFAQNMVKKRLDKYSDKLPDSKPQEFNLMLKYHPPHKRKWYWNLALAVIYAASMFVLLRVWESKINPAHFDLGMQQRIQETEERVEKNLEAREAE